MTLTSTQTQPRGFTVGETVVLLVRTSEMEGIAPLDMDVVTLDSLRYGPDGFEMTLPSHDFEAVGSGDYRLRIDTEGLEAGVYRVRVRTERYDLGVVILTDSFILHPQ